MKTTQTKLIGLMTVFGIISISLFVWIGGGADLFKVFLKDNTQAFSPSNIESVTRSGFEEWSRRFEVSQGDGKTWKMSYPTPNDRLNTSYLVFTETEIQSLISGNRVVKRIESWESEYIFFIESYETISSVLYIEINNKNYLVTSNVGNGSLADLISVFNADENENDNENSPSPTREPDIASKFATDYGPYSSKSDLGPQSLSDGRTLYIVNPGYTATSIPSCVNGKYTHHGCLPTGWTMGMKRDEVYAVRYRTRKTSTGNDYSPYSSAKLDITRNQKAEGQVNQADYIINISDKPGDMTETPFSGLCNITTSSAAGAIYFTYPGSSFSSSGYHCLVPEDTIFYVNVELDPKDYNQCEEYSSTWGRESVCSGYMYENGLAPADSDQVLKGAVFDPNQE